VLTTVVTSDVIEPGDCAGNYVRIVGYQVADACGNINTTTRFVTITVTDTQAPVWGGPDIELFAFCSDDLESLIASNLPTATDNCSGSSVVMSSDIIVPGACAGNYARIIGFTTSDACGNTNTITRYITLAVVDFVAPQWDGPGLALSADCLDDIEALITENVPSATDNCSAVNVNVLTDVTDPGACATIN
jgi:hypothetical protein